MNFGPVENQEFGSTRLPETVGRDALNVNFSVGRSNIKDGVRGCSSSQSDSDSSVHPRSHFLIYVDTLTVMLRVTR